MRRLNVRASQLDACVSHHAFAVDQHQPFEAGELLLLQLVKHDAAELDKVGRRIEWALEFGEWESDPDRSISRRYWPNAGKTWPWIIRAKRTIPAVPFSLEDLPLSKSYGNQNPAVRIAPEDEPIILRQFDDPSAATPPASRRRQPDARIEQVAVEAAMAEARRRFPGTRTTSMARNNPGSTS